MDDGMMHIYTMRQGQIAVPVPFGTAEEFNG